MYVAINGDREFWEWMRGVCDTLLAGSHSLEAVSPAAESMWGSTDPIHWHLGRSNEDSAGEVGVTVGMGENNFSTVPKARKVDGVPVPVATRPVLTDA